ncbi:hypothetical protein [Flavobacterium sp. NKUCC04_CG]|uniref:hypothetical protein n=1 Tax=Flavobacterium sp. NKUCC04_CG TaxID=2842121 RepID=UPI001C5AE815|nr:hypothetical protein [Flavobacterium sp. NKUCC04_CG]MBW3520304.1 hypothetical protein [Flavobacterium sp. NKUCC04_CG]
MRKILILPLVILLACCTTVKRTLKESQAEAASNKFKVTSYCPIEGDCAVKRIPNMSLVVKKDIDGGVAGGMYYQLVENAGTEVVIYTYEKAMDDALLDGFYKEEIIFEIPSQSQRLILENRVLQDVKMLFGRFCYCKGQAGYFQVKQGKLDLRRTDKKIKAALTFKVLEVPQLINTVSFTVE